MEVWDSRAEGGAGGWGWSQDECPSEAIYSLPPSRAIPPTLITTSIIPPFPLCSYSAHIQEEAVTHLRLNHVISVYSWPLTFHIFHRINKKYKPSLLSYGSSLRRKMVC